MRAIVAVGAALALSASLLPSANAGLDTCMACTVVVGLVSEWFMNETSPIAFSDVLANRTAVCGSNKFCPEFLDAHHDKLAAGLSATTTPEQLCIGITLCPVNGTCILFQTWPVTPLGPWPSPQPFPSAIPAAKAAARSSESEASGSESESESESESAASKASTAVQETTKRVQKLVGLLAYLDAASKLEVSASSSTDTPAGLYGLAKSVLRVAVSGQVDNPKLGDPCGLNITCIISRVFDQHLPLADNDGDNFAGPGTDIFTQGFRGADWRGRDCDDADATVYPGRQYTTYPPEIDHNCNGIYGTDPSGTSYEELFCSGSKQRGIAILGDSAAAHFHIPPSWVSGKDWNVDYLLPAAADELDWPECSWSTGYQNTSACPPAALPMLSFYQRLRERNLCMHRDFQNIGVNGGRSTNMQPPGIINAYQRNPKLDTPALIFFALIGNDVCNGHPGTGSMTTPAQFLSSVTASLQYLDTVLPAGSFVLFIGLVDGRVLWDTMNTLTHPVGVPYPDLYNWLSCSGSNPCWGWLNSNATWRNTTTQRANQLNAVYSQIVATQTYNNFEMAFHNPDWMGFIANYTASGGLASDLIEPVDGFHPSQTGNMYLASSVWEYLEQNMPSVLGPVNPYNANITALFGNQGGY